MVDKLEHYIIINIKSFYLKIVSLLAWLKKKRKN